MYFKRIDELKDSLQSLRPLNETELVRLREEFMIENTYDSNAIKGNALTLGETALVLRQGVTVGGKHIKDHLEAIGHRDAFLYMTELAAVKSALSERVIRKLHSLVLMNDAKNKGRYRAVEAVIAGSPHTPPPHFLVHELMEALLIDYEGIKKFKHVIEAIAELHLRFEGIHPFIGGNGRTGRLIMNLELIKAGFLPINIKFTDRSKYYDCFDDYYAGSHTPNALTQLMLAYEEYEISRYAEQLGDRQ
ncbi:MAG: Fic family protein [Synergistaceae bacterium]|jgi:Fic family protein|nr:Fic family protein [Synergistaceae bacterium]